MKRRGINWRNLLVAAGGAVVLLVATGVVTVRRAGKGSVTGEKAGDPAAEQAGWRANSSS